MMKFEQFYNVKYSIKYNTSKYLLITIKQHLFKEIFPQSFNDPSPLLLILSSYIVRIHIHHQRLQVLNMPESHSRPTELRTSMKTFHHIVNPYLRSYR